MTYTFGTPNKPWQQRCWDVSSETKTYAYLFDPGMGKTKSALDVAANAWQRGEIELLIAIAPNGVHRVWPEEAARHLHHVPHDAAFYRAGTVNNDIKRVLARRDRLKIVSLNIESLSHQSGVGILTELMAGRRTMLAVDESQKIRTPGASRTKVLLKYGPQAVLRRILTGTVIIKGLENLYSQYRFLHPDIIGERTYTAFKNHYCIMVGEFHTIVGYKHQEELMRRIAPRTFLAYESEMGLAEPVTTRRPVELSQEQRRVYKDLQTYFLAQLASGELIEGELAIKRLQKFQQIVGGHVRLEEGRGWEPLPCPRIDAAVDVVEAAPSKILVWTSWQPEVEMLSASFTKAKIDHVTYYGGNTPSRNADNLRVFKTGDCHAFLATRASGGAGLTMNEAKRTLNYAHTFDNEHTWQAKKRNHRLGQDDVIHVTNLYAPGTTDAKLLAANARGEDIASIMKDPAKFAEWLASADC